MYVCTHSISFNQTHPTHSPQIPVRTALPHIPVNFFMQCYQGTWSSSLLPFSIAWLLSLPLSVSVSSVSLSLYVFISNFSMFFFTFETCSFWTQDSLFWLDKQVSPGLCLDPTTAVLRPVWLCSHSMWGSGSKLWSPCLFGKHFIHWSTSSVTAIPLLISWDFSLQDNPGDLGQLSKMHRIGELLNVQIDIRSLV